MRFPNFDPSDLIVSDDEGVDVCDFDASASKIAICDAEHKVGDIRMVGYRVAALIEEAKKLIFRAAEINEVTFGEETADIEKTPRIVRRLVQSCNDANPTVLRQVLHVRDNMQRRR